MKRNMIILGILVIIIFLMSSNVNAIDWPVWPDSSMHYVSRTYGTFQVPGYMHHGIDIMVPPGTPVFACKAGYVKAVITTYMEDHWRIAIGDSAGSTACDAWLYAHIEPSTISVTTGQWIEKGTYLGNVVYWNSADFHHLHFVKIYTDIPNWTFWKDWQYISNPLEELDPLYDPDPPVFENAFGSQLLAFRGNDSSFYIAEGEPLSGDLDIICSAYDFYNDYDWKAVPHEIQYRIEGDSSIPWTTTVCFTGHLDYYADVYVIYSNDDICQSQCNWLTQEYYFILTNTDGDSLLEAEDIELSFNTGYFHNGNYEIFVRAFDVVGDITTDSMSVTLSNYSDMNGVVLLADGNPDMVGTIVMVGSTNQCDTTNIFGEFSIPEIVGGSQLITILRPDYFQCDTILIMHEDKNLNILLDPIIGGDTNSDWIVNLLDITFLIAYLYLDGLEPRHISLADVNCSGDVNILDITYMIAYLYKSGPEPQVGCE